MKIQFPKLRRSTKNSPRCDICLIVYGNVLLHTERQHLVALQDESVLEPNPTELAEAARRLLPNTDNQQRISLALPSSEFVMTSLQLPAIAAQNIKNVVNLQLPTLLPGTSEPLLLAVQPQKIDGMTVALWMSSKRADELYRAFNKVGLFLACILPRPLVAIPPKGRSVYIYDEDETAVTIVVWADEIIQKWLYYSKIDCEETSFHQQLEEIITATNAKFPEIHKDKSADWEKLPMPCPSVYGYAFVSNAATAHLAQIAQRKKRRFLAITATLVVLALIVAIGAVIHYEHALQKRLAKLRADTRDVSELQIDAVNIEEAIAPIKNFPNQNVFAVLTQLESLIPKDSWISNFKIENGVVEIEGYSPTPSNLVEILAGEPTFVSVDFSQGVRAEQNKSEQKFGITFKLKGIDVANYGQQYFSGVSN